MKLIDRSIALRFLGNFVTLFCILYVFLVSIDVVLQFDSFVGAARAAVDEGRFGSIPFATVAAIFDFHGPRVFQFFAYMVGLVSVAAAGFTLSHMQRSRELVALLASGFPLQRVALSILVAALGLNALQVVNQELVIPGLAKVLLREHGQILSTDRGNFMVPLTRDIHDNLLYAAELDPETDEATELLVLVRDQQGTAVSRIFAPTARWDDAGARWLLEGGAMVERTEMDQGVVELSQPVASYQTDLSPRSLSVRRYRQHAQMLSTVQIAGLRAEGGDATSGLARIVWSRVGTIGINMLILVIVLPAFLRRLPAPLLIQSVQCATIGVPLLLASVVVMMMPVTGVSPAVMALLPAAILMPFAFWRLASTPT